MKTIITRIQKSSRLAALLVATVVAIITTAVVANATQTITTPNAAKITFSLAAGANSAAITPATNTSVLVMGCCTTAADQGAGHVSLVHIPGTGFDYAGVNSNYPASVTGNDSGTAGAFIVFIDNAHQVWLQVASADTIQVRNGSTGTRAGNVTLVW
jgi:hypothetical protein